MRGQQTSLDEQSEALEQSTPGLTGERQCLASGQQKDCGSAQGDTQGAPTETQR
eukprot:m.331617 g.331617  ORF g.331617 m.331617 type:complete len:54 (-) comp16764_c0_seq1:276-437(-)